MVPMGTSAQAPAGPASRRGIVCRVKSERTLACLAVLLVACGAGAKPAAPPEGPTVGGPEGTDATAAQAKAAPEEAAAATAPTEHPSPAEIFARIKDDLTACYEQGKKAAPKMAGGRVTLHNAVDERGVTTCVIPSDDTGLTQEVEDCMSERLAKERYAAGGAWTTEMPVVVKGGAVTLGDPKANDGASFSSVETHGIPDAVPVIKALMPELDACVSQMGESSGLRLVYVGGRIGAHGEVQCALATAADDVPEPVRNCAAGVISKAKFGTPRSGAGLVSIPVKILGKKTK
jgi:hypothetical protein